MVICLVKETAPQSAPSSCSHLQTGRECGPVFFLVSIVKSISAELFGVVVEAQLVLQLSVNGLKLDSRM